MVGFLSEGRVIWWSTILTLQQRHRGIIPARTAPHILDSTRTDQYSNPLRIHSGSKPTYELLVGVPRITRFWIDRADSAVIFLLH